MEYNDNDSDATWSIELLHNTCDVYIATDKSTNGEILIHCSRGSICVWDCDRRMFLRRFPCCSSSTMINIVVDGDHIACSTFHPGKIHVYNWKNGEPLLGCWTNCVYHHAPTVALSTSFVAAGIDSINVWDVQTGHLMHTFINVFPAFGVLMSIQRMCIHADQTLIAGTLYTKHTRVWDLRTGSVQCNLLFKPRQPWSDFCLSLTKEGIPMLAIATGPGPSNTIAYRSIVANWPHQTDDDLSEYDDNEDNVIDVFTYRCDDIVENYVETVRFCGKYLACMTDRNDVYVYDTISKQCVIRFPHAGMNEYDRTNIHSQSISLSEKSVAIARNHTIYIYAINHDESMRNSITMLHEPPASDIREPYQSHSTSILDRGCVFDGVDEESDVGKDNHRCVICLINRILTVNIPCGHSVACFKCARHLWSHTSPTCPVCRAPVSMIHKCIR